MKVLPYRIIRNAFAPLLLVLDDSLMRAMVVREHNPWEAGKWVYQAARQLLLRRAKA
jgi:hypothetical protein